MTKDEVLAHFQTNFASLKKLILDVAFWAYEPNKDLCHALAMGLQALAETGNKKATALYTVIAAYNNNADCFSKETALQLLFANNAVGDYCSFVCEEFKEDADTDFYEFLLSFPAVALFEEIAEESEE